MAEVVEPREKAVPKYFIESPEKPETPNVGSKSGIVVMIIGGILTLLGLLLLRPEMSEMIEVSILGQAVLIGGIIAGIAGFSNSVEAATAKSKAQTAYAEELKKYQKQYKKAEPKPSDAQMDEWLRTDRVRIRAEALKKLDLEPTDVVQNPIEVIGYAYGVDLAIGKDNVIRFSKYDLVIVYLTAYHLAAYKCTLDMAHGTQTDESTQEYHYRDIVSVATQTAGIDLFVVLLNGEHKSIARHQKFQLTVASGDRIEVVIAFPQLDDIIKQGKLAPTGAEEAIRAIRARLREMKGGVQV